MDKYIFHICPLADWNPDGPVKPLTGNYEAESLQTEGFIHASKAQQVIKSANRFFKGQSGLVILMIDAEKVQAEIKYEYAEVGEEPFPHIYGPLNRDAVIKEFKIEPNQEGYFELDFSHMIQG